MKLVTIPIQPGSITSYKKNYQQGYVPGDFRYQTIWNIIICKHVWGSSYVPPHAKPNLFIIGLSEK